MHVKEIAEVKDRLDHLKERGMLENWELPYENLLTRLDASIFFIAPAGTLEGNLLSKIAILASRNGRTDAWYSKVSLKPCFTICSNLCRYMLQIPEPGDYAVMSTSFLRGFIITQALFRIRSQRFRRFGNSSLDGLVANRGKRYQHGYPSGKEKHPPLNVYPIGKVLQPVL